MDNKPSLIGISGKIGSGKDTVAKIIQYILYKNQSNKNTLFKTELTFENFLSKTKNESTIAGFKIDKFARPLKQVLSILLNVPLKKLEDRDYKEKELNEEWLVWKLPIFYYSYNQKLDCHLPFESGLYNLYYDKEDAISYVNDCIKHNPNELSLELFEEYLKTPVKITPRTLMQSIGTELFREQLHPNTWINALFNSLNPKDNYIISDIRFENEVNAIKKRGGITIRVNREEDKQNDITRHRSETQLDNYKFDYTIENNSDIQSLIKKVEEVLLKIKLTN